MTDMTGLVRSRMPRAPPEQLNGDTVLNTREVIGKEMEVTTIIIARFEFLILVMKINVFSNVTTRQPVIYHRPFGRAYYLHRQAEAVYTSSEYRRFQT